MGLARRDRRILLHLFLFATVLLASACGGQTSNARRNGQAANVVSGTVAGPLPTTSSAPATATDNAFIEIATDNKFSLTNLVASAGQSYTLTLQNRGQAVHDWHITDAKNSNGKEITTPLLTAGKTATISFTITKPGTYHFQCDVHPDDMKGTITVR